MCDDRAVSAAPSRSEGADVPAGADVGDATGSERTGRDRPVPGPGRSADRWPPLQLEPEAAAAGRARRWVSDALADWPPTAIETAQLLLSELVANAVLHARTPIEVRLAERGERAHIAVADGVGEGPLPKHFQPDAETGRGLKLLATLADEWGVERSRAGKSVWFVVGPRSGSDHAGEVAAAQLLVDLDDWATHRERPALPGHPATGSVGELVDHRLSRRADGLVELCLQRLPLSVYLEAEQHNDALLRELTLMVESARSLPDGPEVPRRLLELAEEVRSELRTATDSIRTQVEEAIRQGAVTVDLAVAVPVTGWAILLRMADQLDEADRYCEEGQLLTLASSPTVRALRRWYVTEVAEQLGGRPPRPWPTEPT